jgi:hypothetical protein
MRKVVISYARQNRPDIDQLVEHLRVLGCDTWVDTSLHGGQDWWAEILQRIADCDTFIPIISHEALNCRLNAALDAAPSLEKISRKFAHPREEKRRAEVESRGRAEVADVYE